LKSKKQIGQCCTLYVRREKRGGKKSNDHRQQSDYYKLQHVTSHGKGHGGTSRETVEGQTWSICGITRVA
jgi:hypothetical protein